VEHGFGLTTVSALFPVITSFSLCSWIMSEIWDARYLSEDTVCARINGIWRRAGAVCEGRVVSSHDHGCDHTHLSGFESRPINSATTRTAIRYSRILIRCSLRNLWTLSLRLVSVWLISPTRKNRGIIFYRRKERNPVIGGRMSGQRKCADNSCSVVDVYT